MKVAVAIWLSTAQLHRAHPEAADFSVREIVEQALQMFPEMGYRPGLQAHVSAHCVATKRPDPAHFCMLTETGRGRRRLFRHGDPCHPLRAGGSTHPKSEDVPAPWLELLQWYQDASVPVSREPRLADKENPGDLFHSSAELESILQRQGRDVSLFRGRERALQQLASIRPLPLSPDDLAWIAEDPDLLAPTS